MKKLILVVMMVALITGSAVAGPPPAWDGYQGGWGMCHFDWDRVMGPAYRGWALWVPDDPGYWQYYSPDCYAIDPPPCDLTLQLWIERYHLMTYEFTTYQWHRKGDGKPDVDENGLPGERVDFYFGGLVSSNCCVMLNITQKVGGGTVDKLHFMHDVNGNPNPTIPVPDIPLNWKVAVGEGTALPDPYEPYYGRPDVEGPGGLGYMICFPCDHWFWWWGWFWIPYHVGAGYWELVACARPCVIL